MSAKSGIELGRVTPTCTANDSSKSLPLPMLGEDQWAYQESFHPPGAMAVTPPAPSGPARDLKQLTDITKPLHESNIANCYN